MGSSTPSTTKEPVFTVYKATGKCGRAYVGITKMSLMQRRGSHARAAKAGEKSLFWDYIREKGIDWFTFEAITECYSAREAIRCERAMIAVHNTFWKQGGLNRNIGGGGNVKDGVSDEYREARRQTSLKMHRDNPEIRFIGTRIYNAMGRPVSEHGKKRKAEGRAHGWTKESIAKRQATWKKKMADPSFVAERRHREWALQEYEKALAYRVGRVRPHRFHPSYADPNWGETCGRKKKVAS